MNQTQPINDGGPAFPVPPPSVIESTGDKIYSEQQGMTLRDYFAGQIIAALISDTISIQPSLASREANLAYAISDALIKARCEVVK